jgi:hypothetical protein
LINAGMSALAADSRSIEAGRLSNALLAIRGLSGLPSLERSEAATITAKIFGIVTPFQLCLFMASGRLKNQHTGAKKEARQSFDAPLGSGASTGVVLALAMAMAMVPHLVHLQVRELPST